MFLSMGFIPQIEAAKPRIAAPPKAGTAKVSGVGFMSVRLSRPTNSVIVNLQNLTQVSKVEYTLEYKSLGIDQGVMGSIVPTGNTDSRSLYFGTCSKGVCTPHRAITGAVLTIRVFKKAGGSVAKRYRIRV